MRNELLAQLSQWHEDDKYDEIIEAITAIAEIDRNYDLSSHLARAHNNCGNYEIALEILMSISAQGQEDALWHFRVGYAYFYQDIYNVALPFFEKSALLGDSTAEEFRDYCKQALKHGNNEPPAR